MASRRGAGGFRDTITLAGWLYADLFLALAMLFMVFGTVGQKKVPPPTPYPTYTPGPSPTAYPTYTPGPSPTAYPTWTPPAAPTAYPTYTPGPSPTAYPTYTPGPTATPFPTWTPPAAPTPYPTYTPGPSPTPYPTYTPGPTVTSYPTYTPGPSPTVGPALQTVPITYTIKTNAAVLLGANGAAKEAERTRVRTELRERLAPLLRGYRAGMVLSFGWDPVPSTGNRLAAELNQLLRAELPDNFSSAVMESLHYISSAGVGQVELQIYLMNEAALSPTGGG